METIAILKNKLNMGLAFVFSIFMSVMALAQKDSGMVQVNKNVDSTTTSTTEWYADPLYLIIGAIVLIIIIVLLSRGGKRSKED